MPYALSSVLRNPIFEKEFIALCRTKRWFFFRALMIALIATVTAIIAFTWEGQGFGAMDMVGRTIFGAAALVQVGFVFFLTPGLVADIVVSERRRETLDILMTTPMRPIGILLGKFLSRLCLIAVIVAASFPLVSVSFLYGGVSGEQVLGLLAVTLGTMLLTAGPAALISTISRRLGTAAVLSQVLPVAYCCILPAIAALIIPREREIFALLGASHPLFAAISLSDWLGAPSLTNQVPPSVLYLGFSALVAGACILLAVLRLRRESRGPRTLRTRAARPTGVGATLDEIEAAANSRIAFVPQDPNPKTILAEVRDLRERATTDPAIDLRRAVRALERKARRLAIRPRLSRPGRRRRSRRNFHRMENPVLWKEIHLINSSGSRPLFWTIALLLVVSEILFLSTVDARDMDETGVHISMVCTQAVLLFLLAGVNAATSIVGEKEQKTLELIHVTPLPLRKILSGKFVGVLRSVFILSLIPMAHMLLAPLVSELTLAASVAWVGVYGLLVIFFTVTGLWHSIVAERPARAILKTMLQFAGLMIGSLILLGIFMALTRSTGETTAALSMFHPMFLLACAPLAVLDPSDFEGVVSVALIFSFVAYAAVIYVRARLMEGLYRRHLLGRRVQ